MSRQKASVDSGRITAAQRGTQALDLRKGGMTYQQIGQVMGVNESRAYQLVQRELVRLNAQRTEAAAEVSRLEAERLDNLLAAVWPKATEGDLAAVDRVLSIMSRRAKLLGIDQEKPHQPAVNLQSVNVSLSDADRANAIQSILARVGQRDPGPAPAGADDAAGQVLDHTGSVADGCGAGAGPLADDVPPLFGT
jgi:hypothetical protein